MNHDDLIQRFLEGSASPEDAEALSHLIETNAAVRTRYLDFAELHASLMGDENLRSPEFVPFTSSTPTWNWFSWRPLAAAAAGIVLGMLCTSAVFGFVVPTAGKVMTLLQESFESGPAPLVTSLPLEAGKWSGDFSEIVGGQQGVKPETGGKMLRFLRADYEGKVKPEGSYAGDLYRLIDLRPYLNEFTDGRAVVRTSAGFNSASFPERERYSCVVRAYALSAEMVMSGAFLNGASLRDGALATASKGMPQLDRDPRSWQRVESELRLPAEAEFLLIHVSVSNLTKDEVKDAFRSHYLDEVRVSLLQRSPLP